MKILTESLKVKGLMSTIVCTVQGKREAVIAVYESKPQIADHKVPEAEAFSSHRPDIL